jgi:hypothetical protein
MIRRKSVAPLTEVEALKDEIGRLRKQVTKLGQAGPATIQTENKEKSISPAQGEVLWHWLWNRGYIWHNVQWRPLAPPTYHIKVLADDRPATTGNDKFIFAVSRDMDGMFLYDCEAYITTSGSASVMIRNKTVGPDMLSSPLVISGLHDDGTAVINPATSQVAWKDQIAIDVDIAGVGLGVILVFNPEDLQHA